MSRESNSDDLIYSSSFTDKDITAQLNDRFTKDQIYTRIGYKSMVVVNPNKKLPNASDDSLKDIVSAVKDGKEREPHVFEIAADAYYRMLSHNQDQSILFLGETGSGKSHSLDHSLKALIAASKSKKKEKVATRINKALTVLNAFGNARTIQNDNSSRHGKVCEVQFGSRGKISGLKISDYLLEKQRVTNVQYNERNFNAFYYMIAGLSSEEKSQWKVQEAGKYQFLVSGTKVHRTNADDVNNYSELVSALKSLGFKDKYQQQIFQLLVAILMLGNLEFVESDKNDDAAHVYNIEELRMVAELLGVKPTDLENSMVYKTKLIKKEICTIYLDKDEAFEQRDLLAQTLYNLLWVWIVESINKRLAEEAPTSVINLVDLFGVENLKDNYFHQLLSNFAFEKTLKYANKKTFDDELEFYQKEGLNVGSFSYSDNDKILQLFQSSPHGILTNLNEEASKTKKRLKVPQLIEQWNESNQSNDFYIQFPTKNQSHLFGVRHHSENVHYDALDFVEVNAESASADFFTLFKGGPELRASKNSFIRNLFSEKALNLERAPQSQKVIVDAMQVNQPRRKPTRRRKSQKDEGKSSEQKTFASDFENSLDDIFDVLDGTDLSIVYCIRSNSTQAANRFDKPKVQNQIQDLSISDVANLKSKSFGMRLPISEFTEKYKLALPEGVDINSVSDKVALFAQAFGWDPRSIISGGSCVFLSQPATRSIQKKLRAAEKLERKKLKDKLNGGDERSEVAGSNVSSFVPGNDDDQSDDGSGFSDVDTADNGSEFGSEYSYMSESENELNKNGEKGFVEEVEAEEVEVEVSTVRKYWLIVVRFFTWWIPTRCLEYNGMKRSDIQLAWREKLTLCFLIVLLSALMLFFISGLSIILCQNSGQILLDQVAGHNDYQYDFWVTVKGMVFDLSGSDFKESHPFPLDYLQPAAGKDINYCFIRTPDDYCTQEKMTYSEDTEITVNYPAGQEGCSAHTKDAADKFSNRTKGYKGNVAWRRSDVSKTATSDRTYVIVNNNVYDMTVYQNSSQKYLGTEISQAINANRARDISDIVNALGSKGNSALSCMNKVNFVGQISKEDSPPCVFANSLLLVATVILVTITVFKFLSALRFTSQGEPEDYDRFCILQVPCYTEGEESLRRCLDTLASLKYDDKRKLLFVIADGNIIGSGNDRATWRIVLDILGVDSSIDPPKLSFQSLGEGNKQHNMGKVYTGLYDIQGHLVPYLVVVKVGKDSETRRPGNRGKRDSQMILMRFLQKVHYDEPMSPLELEIYHQMKNVIGVDPSFYEFVLMVDADTEVMPDALNRLVSSMVHDAKIVGLCGETNLANEKASIITMIQVYEYYISHHLAKAFESMFGSVTCLPGCFCMYRIRSPNKSIPLLISKPVIQDYAVNDVDTLHKKNLLSLGEDRYLTTLMLKHFPEMKLSFNSEAQAKSIAPDRWNVLVSQRRRWINSTIHNLAELLLLPQLCGFCCFSMRFVVFFDLFATLVMPASVAYLGYLIYQAVYQQQFPLISLIMISIAYGIQIIIFVMKRKFEHIGWMIIYILATPIFSFFIPIYSFWHFDDFSWGNTRVVVGERGGKKQIVDEEPFDPQSIPMKKWSEYEQEMWEQESQATGVTQQTGAQQSQFSGFSYHPSLPAQSLVGPIQPPSEYPMSPVMMQQIPVQQPPGYSEYNGRPLSMMPQGQQMMMPAAQSQQISSDYPTNDQIVSQIKTYLATANLDTVTKKQVRDDLTMFFGVDMSSRRDFINRVIEDVLQGKM